MRILQIGSSMPDDWGGIERYVTFLARGLIARGHDLTLTASHGSPLAERSKVHVRHLRVRQKYDFVAVARYVRLFRQIRYDIVNTHFSPDYLVPAWAAKVANQRGTVLTRHLVLPLRPGRVRAYSRLYDHFIAVSGAAGDALVESGIPSRLVSVAKAGIPALTPREPASKIRAQLDVLAGQFAVGVFGRLTPEKGVSQLIDALAHTPERVGLHIFGDGPERASLERRAKGHGSRVVFHGYLPDVSDAMNAIDCVAMPSVWAEAFSIALLEALSLGKPIVAAAVGGIPEVVQDRSTGLLADSKDPQAFGKALTRMAEDDVLRETCSTNARELYRDEYTVERFAERVEAVYDNVLRLKLPG